jgi:hypothetical protein
MINRDVRASRIQRLEELARSIGDVNENSAACGRSDGRLFQQVPDDSVAFVESADAIAIGRHTGKASRRKPAWRILTVVIVCSGGARPKIIVDVNDVRESRHDGERSRGKIARPLVQHYNRIRRVLARKAMAQLTSGLFIPEPGRESNDGRL